MILSNRDIIDGVNKGLFNISPLAGNDPMQAPFNTSAIDLRLDDQLQILKEAWLASPLRFFFGLSMLGAWQNGGEMEAF